MKCLREQVLPALLSALKDLGSLALIMLFFIILWAAIATALKSFLNMNLSPILF